MGHNIKNSLPSIKEAWIDADLGYWAIIELNIYETISIENYFRFNKFLKRNFVPPLVKDLHIINNMHNMFERCSSLISLDLSNWDVSNVTGMNAMFLGCSGLTSLDLSSFDTSNVTGMYNMFYDCFSLKEIKCTRATKNKILSFLYNGLPLDFNGWNIVD